MRLGRMFMHAMHALQGEGGEGVRKASAHACHRTTVRQGWCKHECAHDGGIAVAEVQTGAWWQRSLAQGNARLPDGFGYPRMKLHLLSH